jgi:putative flavoprotein involved in K+ transport
MPYLPFPKSWPTFCPGDKLADWMEFYAKAMDINVQCQTKVISAKQDDTDKSWQVQVQQTDSTGTVTTKTVQANHVVFCTGNSSRPRIPNFSGSQSYQGVQLHSSRYKGGRNYAGKQYVIVGSNNSAFAICQDLWEQGAQSVTMIQRTPSMVVSTESILNYGLRPLYSEDAVLDHGDVDFMGTTMPYKLLLKKWKHVTKIMRENDQELQSGLVAAGYRLEYGPDEMGVFAKSATKGGGFYINMGCAELILSGDVEVKYTTADRLLPEAVSTVH